MSSAAGEYPALTRTLREVLRRKKIRYRQVAAALDLAESSIKRILTASDGSVARLAAICRVAGITLADLVSWTEDQEPRHWVFTEEQEAYFLGDLEAFRVFEDLALRKAEPDEVRARRGLSAARWRRLLEKLEHLGLLEATGRASLRVVPRGPMAFRPGSPLLRALRRQLGHALVEHLCRPEGPGEDETVMAREWVAAPETAARFRRALEDAFATMEREATRDEAVLTRDQLVPVAFFAGVRAAAGTGGPGST